MATVSLDLDGTLLHWDRPFEAVFRDAVGDAIVGDTDALFDAYTDGFLAAFRALDPDPYRRGFAAALENRDVDGDPAALARRFRDAEVDAVAPPTDADELLAALATDHDLAVLTNGVPDLQRRKLRAAGLADHVDAVVVSYEVGAHKPDPAAFDAVREALPGEPYVHVGDDEAADVGGAREAGYRGVHVDGDLRAALEDAGLLG